jgi:hypothetical protein
VVSRGLGLLQARTLRELVASGPVTPQKAAERVVLDSLAWRGLVLRDKKRYRLSAYGREVANELIEFFHWRANRSHRLKRLDYERRGR